MSEALKFSHLNDDKPGMVDVAHKAATMRMARAQAEICLPEEVTTLLKNGDIPSHKGPIFHTAIIAATMAVKKTADFIPLCHPLPIDDVKVFINVSAPGHVIVEVLVRSFAKTGVEMEALSGATIAALTIYDMCKSCSLAITIQNIKLLAKSGGKHEYHA